MTAMRLYFYRARSFPLCSRRESGFTTRDLFSREEANAALYVAPRGTGFSRLPARVAT